VVEENTAEEAEQADIVNRMETVVGLEAQEQQVQVLW